MTAPTRRRTYLILFVLFLAGNVLAAGSMPPLQVAIRDSAPFSYRDPTGEWRGIAVEIWEQVALANGWEYEYRPLSLAELLKAVQAGEVDVGVGALSITAERERAMSFTHSFFEGGVGIAVRRASPGFLSITRNLISLDFIKVLFALFLVLGFFGTVVWWFERRRNPGQFSTDPIKGLGDGLWWSAVTMTTVGYGDKAPTSLGGKLVALVWMFCAIVLISSFTAAFAHSLTVGAIESRIGGVEDLPRVRVGTIEGSTAAHILNQRGISHRTESSVEALLEDLSTEKIDAVVFDQPVLHFRIREEEREDLMVLPQKLSIEYYGFVLPQSSDLLRSVNLPLLEFIHQADFRALNFHYLGEH